MISILRYIKVLRLCAVQCFNANQVTKHSYVWLIDVVKQEEECYSKLPKIIRMILNRYF